MGSHQRLPANEEDTRATKQSPKVLLPYGREHADDCHAQNRLPIKTVARMVLAFVQNHPTRCCHSDCPGTIHGRYYVVYKKELLKKLNAKISSKLTFPIMFFYILQRYVYDV